MTKIAKQIARLVLLVLIGTALAEQGARYLIISADSYTGIVQPLAEWKTRKGCLAKIVPVSQIGATPSQIQSYIRNAYNTWPVRPEFVLLVGSPESIPAYGNNTDCYYGDMTGDYKMEIPVGRFFARNTRECSTLVAKNLAYENPDMSDTTWFLKGTTTVNEDQPPDQYYQADSRLARQFWQAAGYTLCESLSDIQGHNSSHVNAAASDGRTFITHRGQAVGTWWPPFNNITPNTWNNGVKMPVVVVGSCATVTLYPGESMYGDQFVRAGTPQALGGAIAYFGTTHTGSHISSYRSACFRGFFTAIFADGVDRLGPATIRGRFWVDSLFHDQTYYQEWNLLGDPELLVWTGIPAKADVQFDSVIPLAPQTFTVTVSRQGEPLPGRQVCLWMDSVVYAWGMTDANGQVHLDINPTHDGEMSVTVTGRNTRPFLGRCRVVPNNAAYLILAGTTIDDYQGNHDGIINPGERARLFCNLHNLGQLPANGVTALLRLNDPLAVLSDSTASYGDILPESTRTGDGFEMLIDTMALEGHTLNGLLKVRDAAADSWSIAVRLMVRAGKIRLTAATFFDSPPGGNGNGRLGRNESGRLQLALVNSGGGALASVLAVLEALDTNVVIGDSTAYYGTMASGQSRSGAFDQFALSAGPGLPRNQNVRFRVRLMADGGTYHYQETLSFELQGEEGTTTEPTGPDAYGYWCYDNTDTFSGRAPVYNWIELAPPGPGQVIPVASDSDAGTITIPIPFPFKFYGITDQFLSVCSNGFLALGYTTYRSGYNRPIPDTAGPPLMIAPFWDDLNPNEARGYNGTAYQFYDTANHRFIVEFKDFSHNYAPSIRESFEAIFYDPVWFPTPTGDGEIIFQYSRVSNNSSCTVGIEDNTETRGIQFLYNNIYDQTAAWLDPGRALKFTTWPPLGNVSPWLTLERFAVSDSLYGNGNGLWEAGESLQIVATIRNRGRYDALATSILLRNIDNDGTVHDSVAGLGTIPPGAVTSNSNHPFLCEVNDIPADSMLDLCIVATANNYVTTLNFTVPLWGVTGIQSQMPALTQATRLEPIRPNPLTRTGHVRFSLAHAAVIDLALFDITGRRVVTLAKGNFAPGRYEMAVMANALNQGLYFCRLSVNGTETEKAMVQKLLIIH
ncbi:MAG: C25 family cysteine peptidase [candidate division WOR-3 bacterium]